VVRFKSRVRFRVIVRVILLITNNFDIKIPRGFLACRCFSYSDGASSGERERERDGDGSREGDKS
jgi:hypothetical protein